MNCDLCPRLCGIERTRQKGYCGMPSAVTAARAALHLWEEPCISGKRGSGAIFFSGCSLRCVFCQNHEIAAGFAGKEISVGQLAKIFINLQNQGANNINLVTPTHFVLPIIQAIEQARNQGLVIPMVYNTGAYENVSTLKMLDGLVDVYLPDLKYKSSVLSERYSNAPDYFEKASLAIEEMVRQTKKPVFYGEEDALVKAGYVEPEMMKRGVIVRHLLLPGQTRDSKEVIRYLYGRYGEQIYISIMNQYTPLEHVRDYPELNRKVTDREYDSVVSYAVELGVTNGFIQEGGTAEESFIPAFDYSGIL